MSVGNQVEKPRFFIDLLQYQYEIGNVGELSSTSDTIHQQLIGLKPTRKYSSVVNDGQWKSVYILSLIHI